MKTHLLSFGFLAAACMALAAAFTHRYQPVRDFALDVYRVYKRAKDWLVSHVAGAFKLAANQGEGLGRPKILLVQAKAFVARLIKRERPVITSTWRHCPST